MLLLNDEDDEIENAFRMIPSFVKNCHFQFSIVQISIVQNNIVENPNPANDYLHVPLSVKTSKLSIEIYDTQGRLQWSKRYNNPSKQISVHVSDLTPGRYQLLIKSDGEKLDVLSFIKQ